MERNYYVWDADWAGYGFGKAKSHSNELLLWASVLRDSSGVASQLYQIIFDRLACSKQNILHIKVRSQRKSEIPEIPEIWPEKNLWRNFRMTSPELEGGGGGGKRSLYISKKRENYYFFINYYYRNGISKSYIKKYQIRFFCIKRFISTESYVNFRFLISHDLLH